MIGNIKAGKLVLAPMAGVNCTSFRLLCKEYGADLIYTQMYDAEKILLEDDLKSFLNITPQERPVSVQLIGGNPGTMAQAASRVEEYADIIDLNFGCCLPEWLAKKTGAYFLKNKDRMRKIIEDVVGAVNCPVSVKTRLGWDDFDPEISSLITAAGADALAVHARTRKQGYMGNARAGWHFLKKISESNDINLIGNGDITKPSHVKGMLDYSGCEMAMIGRTAMDNPLFFKQCKDYLKKGRFISQIRPLDIYKRFIKLYGRHENRRSLDEIRDHAIWFVKNTKNSRVARQHLLAAKNQPRILEIMERYGTPYEL